jgi:hypothetical protein
MSMIGMETSMKQAWNDHKYINNIAMEMVQGSYLVEAWSTAS